VIETARGVVELFRIAWREDRRRLLIALVLMIAQSSALPLSAPALRSVTDHAIAGRAGPATLAALIVAVLVIASLTAGHFAHIFYFELGDMIVHRLERELMALSNDSAGLEHHERPDYADKLQVLRQELFRAGWGSMEALLSSIGLAVGMVITGFLLGMLNPLLLLLPFAAVPPLLLGRRAEALLAASRERAAEPNRRARHVFKMTTDAGPAKELRACGLEHEMRVRQADAWATATNILWGGEVRGAVLRIAGQLVFAVAYVAATLVVVRDAVAGHRTVGDVILAISLAAQVNQQVTAAVNLLQELQRIAKTLADFRWIRELVSRPGAMPDDATLPDRIAEGIDLREVAFRYPGTNRTVLAGVNLHIPAGATIALVGENGAGKTTLVKLLCRFYEATEGVIELDGTDLRRFPLKAWRARIAAGFQDFARFELLARETVGVGHLPDIDSTGAVTAALTRARAEDLLTRLDDGLETQLGKSYADGTELSGGQWQKLALGRAMMRETPVLLLLDEPTSALDAQAEHLLFEQYALGARRVAQQTGAITVLVSHRFSTVRMADLILVVADGKVAESGSHAELMHLGGLYAELFAMQAAAYR
jgi:ATP-binding cassette subfamily B protein